MQLQAPFQLGNPGASVFSGTIKLLPEKIGGVDVFSQKEVKIGANAKLSDHLYRPATREASISVVFESPSGVALSKTEVPVAYESTYYRRFLYVVNDDPEVSGVSELAKTDELLSKLALTTVKASDMPTTWHGYNPASMLVFISPRLEHASVSQLQAVRDFVAGGGVLLTTTPAAALAVAESPLQDMLPADILGTRPLEKLTAFTKWHGAVDDFIDHDELLFAEPTVQMARLLELHPRRRATTTLSQDGLPLVCWRRYGCGWVGTVAFDLWNKKLADANKRTIWNHALNWTPDHPFATGTIFADALKNSVRRLSGFQAATAEKVQRILLVNLLVLVCILAAGVLTKRQVWAWLAILVYAVIATALIFQSARKQALSQSPRSLVAMDFNAGDSSNNGVRAVLVSFFSQTDDALKLTGNDADVYFQPPLPPLKDVITAGMRVKNDIGGYQLHESLAGIQSCRNFRVRALQNRFLGCFAPRRDGAAVADAKKTSSVLLLNDGDPRLLTNAAASAAVNWYLAMGGEVLPCRPVTDDGAPTSLRIDFNRAQALRLDPVMNEIGKFLNEAGIPRNTLIGVGRKHGDGDTDADAAANGLPFAVDDNEFGSVHYVFELSPVELQFADDSIKVHSAQISTVPADSKTRSALALNDEMLRLRSTREEFVFAAILPPETTELIPERIEIEVGIANPDGAIRVFPVIYSSPIPDGRGGMKASPGSSITPTTVVGNRFVFELDAGKKLVNPVTGRFLVGLVVESKRDANGGGDSGAGDFRLGAPWQFRYLNVSVEGRL
jgi:hypothetical protein